MDEEVLDTPIEEETPEPSITVQDSILLLTKKKLGIAPEYHAFDNDVITDVNTVLFTLNQVGIGVEDFTIEDETATWTDFLGSDNKFESVKTYVYLKVRLLFDPPSSSFVLSSMEKQASELEWRLNFKSDNQNKGGVTDGTE